jgi:hypothetical protein
MSWPEWIDAHFVLEDSGGTKVPLRQQNNSPLISVHEVSGMVGTHEFFISARLKSGESYTFTYTPVVAEGKRYTHGFTAPAQGTKVKQYMFEPVP